MEHFKLFTNCKIVKGVNRALILDLQREKSELIPLDLAEIIDILESGKSITEMKKMYVDQCVIDEYIDFLVCENYGFLCVSEDLDLYPSMNFAYETPGAISNAIIEFDTFEAFEEVMHQLNKLGCVYLSVVKYIPVTLEDIYQINKILINSRIVSYEIHGKYDESTSIEMLEGLKNMFNTKLISVNLHNSPIEKRLLLGEIGSFDVNYIEKEITDFKHCGVVSLRNFNTNLSNLSESLNHNSCLNKKLSIDRFGNIKNCPATMQSFGNIKNTTLEEALNHPDFKKYWNITKDQINVCKDCEFRHICTDCRAYTEDPHDSYSKPLKCGYSPYTNQWEEWSTNPIKQKAIAFYDMQKLIIKNV